VAGHPSIRASAAARCSQNNHPELPGPRGGSSHPLICVVAVGWGCRGLMSRNRPSLEARKSTCCSRRRRKSFAELEGRRRHRLCHVPIPSISKTSPLSL
jgi:hypothetical protein